MTEHGICAKCKKSVGCSYADDRITGCKKFVLEPELELANEEWLRSLNTEQLAEWICSVHEKCYYCGAKRVSDREHCPFGDGKCRNNKNEFAMWLKQPHTTRGES